MERYIQDQFDEMRRFAENQVASGELNYVYYLSGTQYRYTVLKRLASRYLKDAILDYSLGILSDSEYQDCINVHTIMCKSLRNYVMY